LGTDVEIDRREILKVRTGKENVQTGKVGGVIRGQGSTSGCRAIEEEEPFTAVSVLLF
jgi:hypothetical protein